jgi:RNA polymerase sigma-70 factor (ECF subfamily)
MHVAATAPVLDRESHQWLRELRAGGAIADRAVARLHALLFRAARFEVARRQAVPPYVRAATDEIALEAADDALSSIRAQLDDFRGESRFTTWAQKFALLEAAVKVRRRAWQGRELPAVSRGMARIAIELASDADAELLDAVRDGIACLTPDERDVLVTLALNGVPIDVLAERRGTSRGALYTTLHDARVKLRRHVADAGLAEN